MGEYPLSRLPVRQITSVTLDGVAVTDYVLWPSGVVRFGTGYPFTYPEDRWYPFSGYGRLAITYSYGFDEPNWTVKRAAILATHSLLNDIAGSPESSKLPSNTSRYSVSNTTLELDPASSQTDTQPWPWDVRASNLVTTYWGPRRPTRFISAV